MKIIVNSMKAIHGAAWMIEDRAQEAESALRAKNTARALELIREIYFINDDIETIVHNARKLEEAPAIGDNEAYYFQEIREAAAAIVKYDAPETISEAPKMTPAERRYNAQRIKKVKTF